MPEITLSEARKILETEGSPVYRRVVEPFFQRYRLDADPLGLLAGHYLMRWDYGPALSTLEACRTNKPESSEIEELIQGISKLTSRVEGWLQQAFPDSHVTRDELQLVLAILFQSPYYHLEPFPSQAALEDTLTRKGKSAFLLSQMEIACNRGNWTRVIRFPCSGEGALLERVALIGAGVFLNLPRRLSTRIGRRLIPIWKRLYRSERFCLSEIPSGLLFAGFKFRNDDAFLIRTAGAVWECGRDRGFAELAVEELHRLTLRVQPNRHDVLLEVARKRLHKNDYYGVAQLVDQILDANPDHPEALKLRITAHLHNQEYAAAEPLCQRLLDLSSEEVWGWEMSGFLRLRLGNIQEGLDLYARGVEAGKETAETRLMLAALYLDRECRVEALEVLREPFDQASQIRRRGLLEGLARTQKPSDFQNLCKAIDQVVRPLLSFESRESEQPENLPPNRPCPLCGSKNVDPYWINGSNGWTISKCENCDFSHINPLPSDGEIVASYHELYLDGVYQSQFQMAKERRWEADAKYLDPFSDLIEWMKHGSGVAVDPINGNQLLDIGCATGLFMERMASEGWQAEGLETSSDLAEMARSLGRRVETALLEEARYPEQSFDLVSCLHVLEHVPDPTGYMREVFRITRPGGYLLLALPINQCFPHLLFGNPYLDQPDHLSFFTPRHLDSLLRKTGFEVSAYRTVFSIPFEHVWLNQRGIPFPEPAKRFFESWLLGDVIEIIARRPASPGQV